MVILSEKEAILMRIYLKRKLNRYKILEDKLEYSGYSVKGSEIIYWYTCGSVCVGLTEKEARKIFNEVTYLDFTRKRRDVNAKNEH